MEPISININGYDTYFTECKDSAGNYLLIAIPSNAGKDIVSSSEQLHNQNVCVAVIFIL